MKTTPTGLSHILWVLKSRNINYVREHSFHPTRKWRFDAAIPNLMLAIEYEGLFAKKSRHTTVSGFTGDTEKYNQAQVLGWRVLRYTAKNYKQFESDLLAFHAVNP